MSSEFTITKSYHGYPMITFKDINGKECSIQKSSVVFENYIWLGCNNPQLFNTENRLEPISLKENEVILHSRMHLNQEQAAKLILVLQKFVNTGEI